MAKVRSDRSNILILMTDQQRWDTLGCAGNAKIHTPNLDRLAASGVRFSNACTSTPVCVAARMSFITGHRASRTHWVTNGALPGSLPELPTIMTLLSREGYWTQGVGKMHFRGRHYGFRNILSMEEGIQHAIDDDYIMYLRQQRVRTRFPKGMRDLLYFQPQTCGIPLEHSCNNWVADRSVEFLREHMRYRSNVPFFLWSSWISPHPPFAPCEPYDSMYDPADMDLPVYTERPLSSLPSSLWGSRGRLDGVHRDPDRIRRIRALYYGQITHVDDALGRILNELEVHGLSENTVILFLSDHGEMLGNHGLSQKNCPYEPSIRVPFFLRWSQRTEAGRVCGDLVGLTDFLPTLMEELGLEYPQVYGQLTGESLLSASGGGLASERDAYFSDYGSGRGRWISIRTLTHKYALYADGGIEELYDLANDPWEVHNLSEEQPGLTSTFRERVLAWERQYGLSGSFKNGKFRTYPRPDRIPSEEECKSVVINEGAWPKRLPEDEKNTIETYAEAFTRAISKETTLSPEKLSLKKYKEKVKRLAPTDPGGESLIGTPWEDTWNRA